MTEDSSRRELLEQEVVELTISFAVTKAFADLRAILADKGLRPSTTILAGVIEGEDLSSPISGVRGSKLLIPSCLNRAVVRPGEW